MYICQKNGVNIYLSEWGMYCRGDYWLSRTGTAILRITNASKHMELPDHVHVLVEEVGVWFDEHQTGYSTLVTDNFIYIAERQS